MLDIRPKVVKIQIQNYGPLYQVVLYVPEVHFKFLVDKHDIKRQNYPINIDFYSFNKRTVYVRSSQNS